MPPLYIPTHTALLTALLGAAPPVRAHEACGKYHPAVAAQLCFPAAITGTVAAALRTLLVARLDAVGLAVLRV